MSSSRKLALNQAWHLDLAGKFTAPIDSQCIGSSEALAPEEVLKFAIEKRLKHLCQKQGLEYAREVESANAIIDGPDCFRHLPASTILTPRDLNAQSESKLLTVNASFDSSVHKSVVLDQVTKALSAHSQTLIEDVIGVADELFTNAIYNAPFVNMLTQVNPGVSRQNTNVQYESGRKARIFLAEDQTRLVIGCEDPFGSLNLLGYLGKIRDTYVRGPAATMNFGPGGAGLGSYIIFNAGSSLYFGVWPGQATVLACVIPLRMSLRKRTLLPKHLHWIQL